MESCFILFNYCFFFSPAYFFYTDQSPGSSKGPTFIVFDGEDFNVGSEGGIELDPTMEEPDVDSAVSTLAPQKRSRKHLTLPNLRKISTSSSKGSVTPPSPLSLTPPFSPNSPTSPHSQHEHHRKKSKLFGFKLSSKSKSVKMSYPEATPAPGDVQFQSAEKRADKSDTQALYRTLSVPAHLNETAEALKPRSRPVSVSTSFPAPTHASLVQWSDQPMGIKKRQTRMGDSGENSDSLSLSFQPFDTSQLYFHSYI